MGRRESENRKKEHEEERKIKEEEEEYRSSSVLSKHIGVDTLEKGPIRHDT